MLDLRNKLSRVGGGWWVVGKAENIATQPSLAGALAELGNTKLTMQASINLNVSDIKVGGSYFWC